MADESDCPVCEGKHPVTWLITHLNPAATMRSCEQDFEAALLALLASRMDVEAGWLTEAVNNAIDAVNKPVEYEPDYSEEVGEGNMTQEEADELVAEWRVSHGVAGDSVTVPDNDEEYPVVTDE